MLVAGFLLFFVSCIAYARFDFSISKSSASYQARIQREEVYLRIRFYEFLMLLPAGEKLMFTLLYPCTGNGYNPEVTECTQFQASKH